MRCFIALALPEHPHPVHDALSALVEHLRTSGVRATWVTPDHRHLTLRFLGAIDEAGAERIGQCLERALEGTGPFVTAVRSVGAFPSINRPGAVWVGLNDTTGGLARCRACAEACACANGFEPESRPFRPHVTLARVRDPRNARPLSEAIRAQAGFDAGEFMAQTVTLYRSDLTPAGPTYTRLKDIIL